MYGRKKKRITLIAITIVCFLILCVFTCFTVQTASKGKFFVTGKVEITVKDYGTIAVSLCGEDAPEAVEQFVTLLESGAYNNLTFYRIVDGFMLQAGHTNESNFSESEKSSADSEKSQLSHTRGAVSIPYSLDADGGMRFFIVQEDSTL